MLDRLLDPLHLLGDSYLAGRHEERLRRFHRERARRRRGDHGLPRARDEAGKSKPAVSVELGEDVVEQNERSNVPFGEDFRLGENECENGDALLPL